MPSLSAALIAASAGVLLFLGFMHLVLTFRGPAFHPRDARLIEQLKADSPRISRGTTMWRAALGFHASHSLGAMVFGLIYAYLALVSPQFLFQSFFLLGLGLVVLSSYLFLAWRFWFKVPLRGIGLAWLLYGAGLLSMLR
jgi:hypothetical protein